jgi:hypothetical protein
MSLAHYPIGVFLAALGVFLGVQPEKIGRIGFGTPVVPKEIPPLPKWLGRFIATELFFVGAVFLAWDLVVHREALSLVAYLFLFTESLVAIVAGISARQLPGFTAKTASRVRNYRTAAFLYAAVGITMLVIIFVFPLIRHR